MTLEQRYEATSELVMAPGDHSRTFNAKDAGTEPAAATDAINGSDHFVGNDAIQKNFKIKQPIKITQFTGDLTGNSGGLGYAKVGLKHGNVPYAPSGRL